MTRTFALLGASGHIARWHADAIASCGGQVVAACDPVPICGYLDKHFLDAKFFTSEFAFKGYVAANPPDYIVIATPSNLHGRQVRDYLPITNVICEKPLGLTLADYTSLRDFAILQSGTLWLLHQRRFIPQLIELFLAKPHGRIHLDFIAPRGDWYAKSWKSDPQKSGGILLNIGIHAFDLLTWIYGPLRKVVWSSEDSVSAHGRFMLERASVSYSLSIARDCGPARREFKLMDTDEVVEFDADGLHRVAYSRILEHKGLIAADINEGMLLTQALKDAANDSFT